MMTAEEPFCIFADFNNADAEGRLRLNCRGTIEDLTRLKLEFVEGDRYILSDGELRVEGRIVQSTEGIWAAEIAWDHIEDIDSEGA